MNTDDTSNLLSTLKKLEAGHLGLFDGSYSFVPTSLKADIHRGRSSTTEKTIKKGHGEHHAFPTKFNKPKLAPLSPTNPLISGKLHAINTNSFEPVDKSELNSPPNALVSPSSIFEVSPVFSGGPQLVTSTTESFLLSTNKALLRYEDEAKKRKVEISVTKSIQHEREAISHDINSKYIDATLSFERQKGKLEKETKNTISMLPGKYLMRHSMFDDIKAKHLNKLIPYLERKRINLLALGLRQWQRQILTTREFSRRRAGIKLSAVCRSFLARRRVQRIRLERDGNDRLAQKLKEMALMSRDALVEIIQRQVRRFIAAKKVGRLLLRNRCAQHLQVSLSYTQHHFTL